MGDVPDVPRNEMSLCSRHMYSKKNGLFAPEKLNIGLFQRAKSIIIRFITIISRGPTPIKIIASLKKYLLLFRIFQQLSLQSDSE